MRNRIWPSSSPTYSLWGQGQSTASSRKRGMMCQWPCSTVWPAARPLLTITWKPSAPVAARMALQSLGRSDAVCAASGSGSSEWSGGMLTGRYDATSTATLVGRVERYVDRDQVIVSTGRPDGLRTNGASLGMDVTMQSGVLWRTELRGYRAQRAVFPMRTGVSPTDAFIVTSLALTF